jgi:hypothetical protein
METAPKEDERPWEAKDLSWPERAKIRREWERERGLEVKIYDGWGGSEYNFEKQETVRGVEKA